MNSSDSILLERWPGRRDAKAFQEIVSRHGAMVYATCRRILRNSSDAQEVAQECFLALAQAEARRIRILGGWLHTFATHRSLDRMRADKRRVQRERRYAEAGPAHTESTWDEIQDFVDEAIAELPEKLSSVIVGHFLEGRSQANIAQSLNLSPSAVSRRIDRAVERIRDTLRKRGLVVSVGVLPGLLADAASGAVPETLVSALGKLALSGAGSMPPAVASPIAFRSVLPVLAGLVIVALGFGVWLIQGVSREPNTVVVENTILEVAANATDAIVDDAPADDQAVESDAQAAVAPSSDDETPPTAEPQRGPSVSGTVKDRFGAPIPKALVRLMPTSTRDPWDDDYLLRFGRAYTDATGRYVISDSQLMGQVTIAAVARGFLDAEQDLTINASDKREGIDFILEESYDFVGRVLSPSGAPVAGAVVVPLEIDFRFSSDDWRRWRLTDEQGYFSFGLQRVEEFESGGYRSTDWKDRYALLEVLAEGQGAALFYDVPLTFSGVVDLQLPQPAALHGTVSAGDGAPLPDHTVLLSGVRSETVNPDGGIGRRFSTRRTATTDADGRYAFQDLAPDMKYFASLYDADGEYVNAEEAMSPILYPGNSTKLDVTAKLQVILTGDVVAAESGTPIPTYSQVRAYEAETGTGAGLSFVTNGASSYRLRLPGPGRYLVRANYGFFLEEDELRALGEAAASSESFTEVAVEWGENQHDVSLPDPFELPVRVVGADGEPIESASLNLSRMYPGYKGDHGALSTPKYTDRDGRYTWFAMPGKEIWISATTDGLSTARTPHLIGQPGEKAQEIELVLRTPGDIFGRLVRPNGTPVEGGNRVSIRVLTSQGQGLIGTGATLSEDGSFHVPGCLREDELLVTVAYKGNLLWPEPLLYEGPADVDLDLGDITVWPEP